MIFFSSCSIGGTVGEFVEIKDLCDLAANKQCNYARSFGSGHLCVCPVRREIYKKYKI
jgi:hypothetical protein